MLALALGVSATACGGGGGGSLDCSMCPDDIKNNCSKLAKACKDQGVSDEECQQGVDATCALAGAGGSLGAGGSAGSGGSGGSSGAAGGN